MNINIKDQIISPELRGLACPRVLQCRLAAKDGNECKALKRKSFIDWQGD